MPEKCLSCGECAVIEDDIEGRGLQKICEACGTVATRNTQVPSVHGRIVGHASLVGSQLNRKCQSCDVALLPDVEVCLECSRRVGEEEDDFDMPWDDESPLTGKEDLLTPASATVTPLSGTCAKPCHSCGSTNLSRDSIGVDERLVCCDCGTVADSETLMTDEFDVGCRSTNNNYTILPKRNYRPKKLPGRTAGLEKIAFLQSKFSFQEFLKEEAVAMFDLVIQGPRFYRSYLSKKSHLAAACLFIVCRQHDIPVSLAHFSRYVENFSLFLKCRKLVFKCLNIQNPVVSLTSQVQHLVTNHGLDSAIISKVMDILFLCRQAWLTQGRSRDGLIIIAAYFSYLSSDKCTSFVTMSKFREMFNFPILSTHLQAEINTFLQKLACKIPWVAEKNVKLTTVYRYIDDILKYQNSLLHLAFESNPGQHSKLLLPDQAPSGNKKEYCKKGTKDSFQKESLLPSASKKVKREVPVEEVRISSSVDLDNPEVVEAEFNDDEINSYLLTTEEAKILRAPKLMYMNK